jgi:LysR family transcriptional regulator for bpeEF and oprC
MDRFWAMQVFVRVIEAGSFSRAATSLGLANASVTTCINNLERHLGVTLIQRSTRHLRLTEEGAQYLSQCHAILRAVDEAESGVKSHIEQMSGLIRVEVPMSIGRAMICPALSEFARRHPDTSVAVTLTNQPHNMIERAIDVAIRMDSVEDADLVARPIYEARYVVCGTPAMAARAARAPAQLDPALCLGLLTERRIKQVDWSLSKGGKDVVVSPAGPLHFNSSDALVNAARNGDGLICVLDIFVNRYLAANELVALYPDWTTGTKTFYAVTTKTRMTSTKVRTFIAFLQETLGLQRLPDAARAIQVQSLHKRA